MISPDASLSRHSDFFLGGGDGGGEDVIIY